MWRQTGVKPEQLNNDLPEELRYLWHWFIELHNSRGAGLAGLDPISYSEIEAWSRLTGNEPETWEIQAIKRIDAIACRPEKDKK